MENLSSAEKAAMRGKCEREALVRANELKAASNAARKSVNVEINTKDLIRLKDSGYRMCFAKKVGTEDYNVIWQSYNDFSENNNFSWTPEYQVFRTDNFEAEVTVKVSSNPKDIGLGDYTVIDKYGILSDPVTGGDEASINVHNEYKPTHIGISQISTGIHGEKISTPIYVSQNECMTGDAKFKPVEKVMVWFEYNAETSIMFTDMKSEGKEIDLTTKNEATVRYENGKWLVV